MIFWNNKTQQSIIKYYKASTKEEKNKIFSNELYNDLLNLTKQALFTCSGKIDVDDVQDLLLFLNEYVLPKITEELIQASHQYIWIALKRRIYSIYEERKIKQSFYVSSTTGNIIEFDYYSNSNEFEELNDERKKLLRFIIMNEIDNKIIEQEVINKKASIFLILLKQYTIENDYDVRGFRNYCCERMNVTNTGFSNLCSVLKIINKDFYLNVVDERKVITDKANKYLKK